MDEFLKKLDTQRSRTTYARITSLSWNESPIETLEGRVTQGSINVDGASAVRRSCNLTMVAQDININEYLWGYKTKFKLEIGLKNDIDSSYPDIIWFNQGIYVITSFTSSLATNTYTINIQGKDKMCLLNGEVGGSLSAETRFDSYDQELKNGSWETVKYKIKQIIRDAVHQYANEPLYNIVINDVDNTALELLEYQYDEPMYLYRRVDDDIYENGNIGGDIIVYVDNNGVYQPTKLNALPDYDSLVSSMTDTRQGTVFYLQDTNGNWDAYVAAEIKYGDTAGYRTTDLIYNDDLILNAGEALTSMLDKLVNMLGQFEYFYDVDGTFVFQEKKNGLQTNWSPIVKVEDGISYVDPSATSYLYSFQSNELFTAFNNSPNMANLRNDFSVWGNRNSDIAIHMRYAIDEKPTEYVNYDGRRFVASDKYEVTDEVYKVDWREIIYQMQADYRQHNREDDFYVRVMENNPWTAPTGMTGYEQYYIDIEGFWRQLYYPGYAQQELLDRYADKITHAQKVVKLSTTEAEKQRAQAKLESLQSELENWTKQFNEQYYLSSSDKAYWNINVYENPELLNYWIDFLDGTGELQHFSNKMIGNRPKVVNDKDVKSIYFRETPAIIFADETERDTSADKTGYRYFNNPNYDNMFSTSTQGKSAKDSIDELIYNHSYAIEAVTITCIPIYHLEPNIRIYIGDANTGIDGEYIATKYTIPLQYNGTMTITATKAPENLF